MNQSTAVRYGIPVRRLAARILIPFGLMLLSAAVLLSFMVHRQLKEDDSSNQRATVKTIFETSRAVHSGVNGLSILAQNRGYERIWVLSATGDILESNRGNEVGQQVDSRWWSLLEGRPTGLIQEDVRFGEQRLSLTAIHNAEMGRWVVALSRPTSLWPRTLLYLGSILALSLILWIVLATLTFATLSRKISGSLRKLDERAVELIKGGSVSEASLDRLWAETSPSLGGHADCVLDLARHLQISDRRHAASEERFRAVFDAMPTAAFIRGQNSKILDCNQAMANRLNIEQDWIIGRDVTLLKGIVPITLLEKWFQHTGSPKVGVRSMDLFPSDHEELAEPVSITISPMSHGSEMSHLVIIEMLAENDGIPIDTDSSTQPSSDASTKSDKEINEIDREVDSKTSADSRHSGDGAPSETDEPTVQKPSSSGDTTEAVHKLNEDLLNGVMELTGQVVIVFDEDAKTMFWSPKARLVTGLTKDEIPNMKSFADRVFSDDEEKKVFQNWIDREPEKRSQELKIRAKKGTVSSRWYAAEMELQGRGAAGVLWASIDVSLTQNFSD